LIKDTAGRCAAVFHGLPETLRPFGTWICFVVIADDAAVVIISIMFGLALARSVEGT
jgi:hypothetical protein